MSGPNRINFAGVAVSVAGHAAILSGLFLAAEQARPPATQAEAALNPLVVTLAPLSRLEASEPHRQMSRPVSLTSDPDGSESPPPVRAMASPPPPPSAKSPKADAPLDESVVAATELRAAGLVSQGQLDDYQRRLNALIASHSRYPEEARRLGLAGVTALAFRVDRSGRVLESWIQDSSGSELLDNAALEALDRAQPLPPIPAGLPGQIDFVVQVDSSLVRRLAIRQGF